ncbi:hypothetical protein FQN51_000161 [Onygenales sp. PD_10]|nr:hypothetical protein FQN51_000161 [Onygenales sp. PD_10]
MIKNWSGKGPDGERVICSHELSGFVLEKETNPDAYRDAYSSARRAHISATLDQLNAPALTTLASSLRRGTPCTIPALALDREAQLRLVLSNATDSDCHIDINFQDGEVWNARIRLRHGALPPLPVQKYIFLSEMFTLKFLQKTRVPAPEVCHFGWVDSPDNPLGVSYVLLKKIKGRRLQWETASKSLRTKILEQLVDISLELERHPFEMTGSIVPSDDGEINIGGYAQLALFRDSQTPIGPFSSLNASLRAIMHLQLDIISDGGFSSLPVAHFLSYLWRLHMIHELVGATNSKEGGPFYLKHFCEVAHHIFVDDDGNITGITNWSSAAIKSKEYAFSSPPMLWPMRAFVDGDNSLSPDELEFADIYRQRNRPDLADIVLKGRKLQRFLYSLGDSWTSDQKEFEALFQGLRKAFIRDGDDNAAAAVQEPFDFWKRKVISKYSVEYPQLQRLF